MIVADRKSLEEILDMIKPYKKILLVGCKGCVTVCNVGGAKEVGVLAATLKIGRKKDGHPIEIDEKTLERQCDPEYVEQIRDIHDQYDAVLSMACGVGPQFLSEAYPGQTFLPAVNTKFFGGAVQHGIWEERCAGCGTCIIHYYDGLCPIARCSKSLQHGPCGGSAKGKCEISKDVECIWDTIVKKKMEQGRLEDLRNIRAAKDWQTARDGGPRKSIREELVQ
jgi:ferredoxin